MKKIQIEVYKGIDLIKEMVKLQSLCVAMGKNVSWISIRTSHMQKGDYTYGFLPSHLDLLNEGLEKMAERIAGIHIEYKPDRTALIDHIKEQTGDVNLPYLFINQMGHTVDWYKKRFSKSTTTRQCSLKEEDIIQLNLAIQTVAARLGSMELVLEAPDDNPES